MQNEFSESDSEMVWGAKASIYLKNGELFESYIENEGLKLESIRCN